MKDKTKNNNNNNNEFTSLFFIFSDIVVEALNIKQQLSTGGQLPYEETKSNFVKLFEEAKEKNIRREGFVGEIKNEIYPKESFEKAKYAVVAFVDEIMVSAENWSHRNNWMKDMLQKQFYNSALGGSEFFEKMNSIREITSKNERDVLEVYYYCMVLGFEGQYYDDKDRITDIIKTMFTKISGFDELFLKDKFAIKTSNRKGTTDYIKTFGKGNFIMIYLIVMLSLFGGLIYYFSVKLGDATSLLVNLY